MSSNFANASILTVTYTGYVDDDPTRSISQKDQLGLFGPATTGIPSDLLGEAFTLVHTIDTTKGSFLAETTPTQGWRRRRKQAAAIVAA